MVGLPPSWSLSALILLGYAVSTHTLSCDLPERPLPQDSCLLAQTTPTASWTDSGARCVALGHTGLAVITDEQFTNLVSYAEVLGRGDELFWLGYMYSSSSQLQDTSGTAANSMLLVDGNYGDGVDPAGGVCVAVGGDRLLHRRPCSESHASFCLRVIATPTADISVDPGRFITTPGSPVTLTCTPTSPGTEVRWVASTPAASQPQPVSQNNTYGIDSFAGSDKGAYYCIASNELGEFVLDPVVLVDGPDTTSGADVPNATITASDGGPPYLFGSSFSLDCAFNSAVSSVQWFINGSAVEETSMVGQTSTLTVEGFQEEGYYQCFVSTDRGLIDGASLLVNARADSPTGVDLLAAEPNSRDELFVQWVCPEPRNTHDVGLLRYTIQYRPGRFFDNDAAETEIISDVIPVLLNGSEARDCVVEALIPDLMLGTTYSVKVVAMAAGMMGEVSREFAVAATYGSVPPVITDLRVTRAPDNKQVIARWGAVKTTPPVGTVTRYQIQYRDFKGSISTVFHSRRYNYLVVNNVINANGYEVRVSSGVIAQRDPIQYEYSDFTEWVKVDGISNTTPTQIPLNTSPPSRLSATAAGIVVGVLVLIVIVAILVMGVFCCVYKRLDPQNLEKKGPVAVGAE